MSERVAIGIDVGGTTIKYGVVHRDGRVERRGQIPTLADEGPDAVLVRIADAARKLLGAQGHIAAIGIGVPGIVNPAGEVANPPNFPGWEVMRVGDCVRELLGTSLPIAVENDANVAAYAEWRIGSGKDLRDFLFVTLGTGVGGAVISGGKIWHGETGGAGEIGHITIDMNGQLCNCGARGCVESYIGQRYMTAYVEKKMTHFPESRLHQLVADGNMLEPRLINEAAEAGDVFSQNFLTEMGRILGAALASAMNMCDLHTVIVGGGLSRAETFLLGQARRTLRARVLKPIARDVSLRVASLAEDAGITGAALLALATD